MKRKSILALTVAAALGAAIAVPAFADGYHGHRGGHAGGPHSDMGMMRGQGGMGMMHGRGGMGDMDMMNMMQGRMDSHGGKGAPSHGHDGRPVLPVFRCR